MMFGMRGSVGKYLPNNLRSFTRLELASGFQSYWFYSSDSEIQYNFLLGRLLSCFIDQLYSILDYIMSHETGHVST